jgi:hypothetical protein
VSPATKAQLAKTVKMPVVAMRLNLDRYTEIELMVLGYLADHDQDEEVTELRAADLYTTQTLPAIEEDSHA